MNRLPDSSTLLRSLSSLLSENGISFNSIKIIHRKSCIYVSTFPSEIIKCELDSREVTLFCKYLNGLGPNNNGHRGGVEYEARVYNEILRETYLSSVRFYGVGRIKSYGEIWMVLEYKKDGVRLDLHPDINIIEKAVEWIAKFHLLNESNTPSFLTLYNELYYSVWVKKVENFCNSHNIYSWLFDACSFFKNNIKILTECPTTLIHGEYYPNNILIEDGIVYPIDWESAAIGVGEIDLASILEGWDDASISQAIKTYTSNRWPNGNFYQEEFKKRFLMAQIYFHLRWLGDGEPEVIKERIKNNNTINELQQLTTKLIV